MFSILGFGRLRYAIRSPRWRTVRKEFIKNNNSCAACGSTKDLEVHHVIPVHIDESKELDMDNLITLCSESCHILFGHLMDFKSHNPMVREDCALMSNKIKTRPYLE
jgi:5-methylcytosine-specific restriction endonuclease McrA